MRLSTRVRFGLRIMIQIAQECGKGPVFARRIASAQGMSEAYVDQILIPLRSGGLLLSQRGRAGGYLLARPADRVTVLDIVEVLEGHISLVDCTDNTKVCERVARCAAHRVWCALSQAMRDTLAKWTLRDLAAEQTELTRTADYVI